MTLKFNCAAGSLMAAALMVVLPAQVGATTKTVAVAQPGTLGSQITASEKNEITSLTVSGTLNGSDVLFIREMAGVDVEGEPTGGKLTELDLSGVALTDGGEAYYADSWSSYYTATSYDVNEDEDEYYCTDLSYAFTGSNLTKVVWPATMWEVGEQALSYCSDLKSFTLGSETNEIKSHAFYQCGSLEAFDFTAKIIYVDDFAFAGCRSLKSVALPSGLEMLDKSSFSDCSSLSSVTFGDVTEIRDKAFYGCKALNGVELPATLTKLGNSAFDGCSSLTAITLPKKLKTLGEGVFEGCTALSAINVEQGNASFASVGGVLFDKACTKLIVCPVGKSGAYAVPSGTEEIAASAFSRCVGLTEVLLPEGLTTIGDEAFYRCSGLAALAIPNSVTSVGQSIVYRCSALKSVTLGAGLTSVGESMFYYANGLESIEVPEGYTSLGYEAFASCSALKEVTLPSTLTAIDAEAFLGCSSLSTLTVKAATPIAITADVFEDVDQSACTLYVPQASVEAYKADAQWCKFGTIEGIEATGVADVTASASVSVADGVLTVYAANGAIAVYNMAGACVAQGAGRVSVAPGAGVYVVVTDGKAVKVALR